MLDRFSSPANMKGHNIFLRHYLIKILLCVLHVLAHWQSIVDWEAIDYRYTNERFYQREEENGEGQGICTNNVTCLYLPNISFTASTLSSFPISLNLLSTRAFISSGLGKTTTAI